MAGRTPSFRCREWSYLLPYRYVAPDRLIPPDCGVVFQLGDGSCQLQCQPEQAALAVTGQVTVFRSLAEHVQSTTQSRMTHRWESLWRWAVSGVFKQTPRMTGLA